MARGGAGEVHQHVEALGRAEKDALQGVRAIHLEERERGSVHERGVYQVAGHEIDTYGLVRSRRMR